MNKQASYTSASVFPAKLLQSSDVVVDNLLVPVHIQMNPTNRCNLNCPWCSCANRDSGLEQGWHEIKDMLTMFSELGTKAVTITGGGEPLMHPHINGVIDKCHTLGIKVGLVTNGTMFKRLDTGNITWSRISFSDTRDDLESFCKSVKAAALRFPNVDWAISYVVSRTPDIPKIEKVIALADELKFTHVRLVSDLLDLKHIPDLDLLKANLAGKPGEELIVYQGRKDFTNGVPFCLISLIKPLISADGGLYPCCGSQYAMATSALDYEKAMRMGHWSDWPNIMRTQRHFDGSACVKCYYGNYNEALALMTSTLDHKDFV